MTTHKMGDADCGQLTDPAILSCFSTLISTYTLKYVWFILYL